MWDEACLRTFILSSMAHGRHWWLQCPVLWGPGKSHSYCLRHSNAVLQGGSPSTGCKQHRVPALQEYP